MRKTANCNRFNGLEYDENPEQKSRTAYVDGLVAEQTPTTRR